MSNYFSFLDDGARRIGSIAVVNIVRQISAEINAIKCAFFPVGIEGSTGEAFGTGTADIRSRANFVQVTHGRFIGSCSDKVSQLMGFIPAEDLTDFPSAWRQWTFRFRITVVQDQMLKVSRASWLGDG